MSYAALATDRFDEVTRFYGESLGFPVVDEWDRPNGRGVRFDLGGMRLEILDNQRQKNPLAIPAAGDRFHVVVEVDDVDASHAKLPISAPAPVDTSWGARLFQLRDPDGVPVTYLEWTKPSDAPSSRIRGKLVTGIGVGKHFTRLDWAREQFVRKLGIDPHPGTVNLVVSDPDSERSWAALKQTSGIRIENPGSGPNDCDARCFPVTIEGDRQGAIVLPEVNDYAADQIEVIAEAELRSALEITDGDSLALEITTPPQPCEGRRP